MQKKLRSMLYCAVDKLTDTEYAALKTCGRAVRESGPGNAMQNIQFTRPSRSLCITAADRRNVRLMQRGCNEIPRRIGETYRSVKINCMSHDCINQLQMKIHSICHASMPDVW